MLTAKETWKLHITGHLWGDSTNDWWISSKKASNVWSWSSYFINMISVYVYYMILFATFYLVKVYPFVEKGLVFDPAKPVPYVYGTLTLSSQWLQMSWHPICSQSADD